MKSNKLITVLIVVAVILALVLSGVIGYLYYKSTHIFVDNIAYPKDAESLDLSDQDISFNHYQMLNEQLPDCSILWSVPFHGTKISSGTMEISVSDLNEADIDLLCLYFPELKKVDASDCQNYAMLELLIKKAPHLNVEYKVSLGEIAVAPDTEELILKVGEYDYDIMMKNLPFLRNLKSIQLKAPELTKDQVQFLRDARPEVKVTCTVALLGKEYDVETTHLDLRSLRPDMVDMACSKLSLLPELETVDLSDAEGNSQLSPVDVKKLMDAVPDVVFQYVFDFYGQKLSTNQEEVIVKKHNIGNEGEQAIRSALDILKDCKRFVLDDCNVSSEIMAKIRDDYRDRTKVVWRIWFGEGTSLTDAEILRSTYNVDDDNSGELFYLEDVRYMDIGHNEWLDHCDFISGMKSLEVCIVSGAPIHSLEPFRSCKNLRILEMANCIYVPDLEPLRELENLKMLNLGFTRMKSLEPVYGLDLTHLTVVHCNIPLKQREEFQQLHPDCWIASKGDQPYGKGWRYDNNNDPLPWYEEIKGVFRYPKAPNNVGWYLDK